MPPLMVLIVEPAAVVMSWSVVRETDPVPLVARLAEAPRLLVPELPELTVRLRPEASVRPPLNVTLPIGVPAEATVRLELKSVAESVLTVNESVMLAVPVPRLIVTEPVEPGLVNVVVSNNPLVLLSCAILL